MNLLELRTAIAEERISQAGRTTLIWGLPRTGKTRWALTVAKAEQIKRVFFFDFENGWETVIHAKDAEGNPYLSDSELAKIQVIRVLDLPENPRAIKTIDAVFRNKARTIRIDGETGDFKGKEKKALDTDIIIEPSMWGPDTAIILDTIGQIGVSALNKAELAHPDYKDKRNWYGDATHDLNGLFTMIQASSAYVIACTHVLIHEVILSRDKSGNPLNIREDYYPQCLSKNYSLNVGKYFGSIIYRWIELKKFHHLSSPTKMRGIQAGTRTDIDISADLDATLPEVLKLIQAKTQAQVQVKA